MKPFKKKISFREIEMNTTLVVIALVAILALLGVVIVLAVMTIPLQEAEAGCERGPAVNRSFERSSGKCFDRGTF